VLQEGNEFEVVVKQKDVLIVVIVVREANVGVVTLLNRND
jgi:hypothetical protein